MKHVYIFYGDPASGKSIIGRMIAEKVIMESVCVIDDYNEMRKTHSEDYKVSYSIVSAHKKADNFMLLEHGVYHFIKHSEYNIFIIITPIKDACFKLLKSINNDSTITLSTVRFSRLSEYLPSDVYNQK